MNLWCISEDFPIDQRSNRPKMHRQKIPIDQRLELKHRDSFGKEKKKKKSCSIYDKTLSKVFLNNFHAMNRS